jgi:hypothetical protein
MCIETKLTQLREDLAALEAAHGLQKARADQYHAWYLQVKEELFLWHNGLMPEDDQTFAQEPTVESEKPA